MPTDPIDTAVAKAKTPKLIWLWGSLMVAFGVWLLFWWVSSNQISVTLPDGRVISYAGVLKGTRVTDNEFEPYIYFYPEASFMTIPERIGRKIERLVSTRRTRYVDDQYRLSPDLLMSIISCPPSSDAFQAYLDDDFGNVQSSLSSASIQNNSRPKEMNSGPLPIGTLAWKIKFWNHNMRWQNSKQLGELEIPNPLSKPASLFEGKITPLESRTSKGALQLLSANYSISKAGNYDEERYVTLEFNASACPNILPCHVIGVRITDSWGNTGLIERSISRDGKTILAKWHMGPEFSQGVLQSVDWHIKIAICRGRGASFAADEIAIFDHFITSNYSVTPVKRIIQGRELTLLRGHCGSNSARPDVWKNCGQYWELDQKPPLLWPIIVNAVGYTSEGTVVEIDPTNLEDEAYYRVERERFKQTGHDTWSFTNDFLFKSGFMSPPNLTEIDLHVALEEPQVFEFFAKVSNWPTVPSEKK